MCVRIRLVRADHAHLHAFPVSVDVRAFLAPRFTEHPVASLADLRGLEAGSGGYLYLRQGGAGFHYPCDVIPSQYIRQIIAAQLGVPERWNWRSYLGLPEFARTWQRLARHDWTSP